MTRNPLYLIVRTVLLVAIFSVLGYVVLRSMPGDPLAMMLENNPDFTYEDYMRLRSAYGLDSPGAVAYFSWVSQNVQGNYGYSTQYKIPIGSLLMPRLINTLILLVVTTGFSLFGVLLAGL